jgi:hypothetical protein
MDKHFICQQYRSVVLSQQQQRQRLHQQLNKRSLRLMLLQRLPLPQLLHVSLMEFETHICVYVLIESIRDQQRSDADEDGRGDAAANRRRAAAAGRAGAAGDEEARGRCVGRGARRPCRVARRRRSRRPMAVFGPPHLVGPQLVSCSSSSSSSSSSSCCCLCMSIINV